MLYTADNPSEQAAFHIENIVILITIEGGISRSYVIAGLTRPVWKPSRGTLSSQSPGLQPTPCRQQLAWGPGGAYGVCLLHSALLRWRATPPHTAENKLLTD